MACLRNAGLAEAEDIGDEAKEDTDHGVGGRSVACRTSPRAYDAQLLLAQARVGERQYAQAAIAFDDTYNRSSIGAHAQDAPLGLASALASINEPKAACDTLARLRREFPQPRADLREVIIAAGQRIGGCTAGQ